MDEIWELDAEAMTLNDFKVIQKAVAKEITATTDIDELIGVLDRIITNKTADEIANTPLRALNAGIERALGLVEQLIVPKASDAPS
jgi:hypothetical protein